MMFLQGGRLTIQSEANGDWYEVGTLAEDVEFSTDPNGLYQAPAISAQGFESFEFQFEVKNVNVGLLRAYGFHPPRSVRSERRRRCKLRRKRISRRRHG